jgi:hypothetical protein
MNRFETFWDFYPYYLSEHRNGTCRVLHFIGTAGVITLLLAAALTRRPQLLIAVPLIGYGFAWVGHFVFERNRPATFKYPSWSLRGDFVMFADILLGRVPMTGLLPTSHYADFADPPDAT